MRRSLAFKALLVAAALSFAPAPPAVADPAADSRAVIERQLDAFQRDDWAEAFAFASPSIQRQFQNPERFSEMVRGGYPMVWRPADVAFLDAERRGAALIQRLRLTDAAGIAYIARYQMVEIDGAWRIAGVFIERAPDVGA